MVEADRDKFQIVPENRLSERYRPTKGSPAKLGRFPENELPEMSLKKGFELAKPFKSEGHENKLTKIELPEAKNTR